MDRCRREMAAIEDQLRAGHPDLQGLCLALADWSAELRILRGACDASVEEPLRKLAARIDVAPSWVDYLRKPSGWRGLCCRPLTRDLVADAIQLRKETGCDAWTETHRSVWQRRSIAFDRAVAELRIPYSMSVADQWL